MTRLSCIVPFCRRTTGKFAAPIEWICGPHYRLVPSSLKLRRRRVNRLLRKAWVQSDRGRALLRLNRLFDALWDETKAIAIQRSAGITA